MTHRHHTGPGDPPPWWKRVRVRVGFDPHNPAWPFSTPWSRHEIALYLLCFFVQVEWFPREWDDGADAPDSTRTGDG